ncbi:3-ketoacyl-ACP reductase [Cellulomonas marina]|uniref:NAD(P)-dependent dehydrogenase, short-chain alcohol dehydrogenase family n=1 Tax=Cellulomonas marina TaxID=988821 RepID=A0A1I1AKX2_9CELL|nr:3-ketoacyl-ACP reductase [Cellulomonas marina]GIG30146.1 3-ketoacyl-ACP reductase [Cellulomonas marina]SFB38142.1 NAD(P)-dependent dehydrogenase, short-chain alcohol dehydrogenase family [Cellulomonas marina]
MPATALVTGGNRGIGLGITRRLLQDGWAVSILATRPAPEDVLGELRELAGDEARVRYVQGSVAEPVDHERYVQDAVDAWGRLDLLVNNAGVAPSVRADILEAGTESFDRVLGINLRGPYFLTQRFAQEVIRLRGPLSALPEPPAGPVATVVNVSSISATTVSVNRGDYCISKAGVGMATQLWAARLAPEGVVVYEVRPGVIATDMTAGVTEKYDAVFAGGSVPIARWGRPSDVAGAVAILASGQTPYSTGEVFHVDGGMHIPTL